MTYEDAAWRELTFRVLCIIGELSGKKQISAADIAKHKGNALRKVREPG